MSVDGETRERKGRLNIGRKKIFFKNWRERYFSLGKKKLIKPSRYGRNGGVIFTWVVHHIATNEHCSRKLTIVAIK